MPNSDDLNQTYLDARQDLENAKYSLPRGSDERLAVENSIKELDVEILQRAEDEFSEGSSNLEALAAKLGTIVAGLDPNSLSTAIDKINAAVGKVNTLAQKVSDLTSSGDDV